MCFFRFCLGEYLEVINSRQWDVPTDHQCKDVKCNASRCFRMTVEKAQLPTHGCAGHFLRGLGFHDFAADMDSYRWLYTAIH